MLSTSLSARPSSLAEVATYLANAVPHLHEWELQSQSAAREAREVWTGEAATGYATYVDDGAKAAGDLAREFETAAENVSRLLETLRECEAAMSEARARAIDAGLLVIGDSIYPPVRTVWEVYQSPGATGDQVLEASNQASAWSAARNLEYRARRTWKNAVESYIRDAPTDSVRGWLAGTSAAGSSAMAIVNARVQYFRRSESALRGMSSTLGRNLDALVVDGRIIGSRQHYYRLLDERGSLSAKLGSLSDESARAGRLASKAAKASVALGAIGFGYGTYADIQDGESTSQALVSNGVDWAVAAGFTAGGAAIGTAICPVVGTVIGGVVGGVVGVFAGGFANGVVDHLFEDLSPDVGGALSAGWSEVEATGEAIGGLFVDAWDAIF